MFITLKAKKSSEISLFVHQAGSRWIEERFKATE
jgi:hypothetical protein